MIHQTEYPYGYFADTVSEQPLLFQDVCLRHMAGKPLPGIWGLLFPWVKIPQYLLLEDILYFTAPDENGIRRRILVKRGFIFDGGSVPFLFWWLYPPDQPDCLPAFVVHDWECTPPYPVDSPIAHLDLHDACRANGAKEAKANHIWLWVRLAGPRFKAQAA